jgi:hypothetical protein
MVLLKYIRLSFLAFSFAYTSRRVDLQIFGTTNQSASLQLERILPSKSRERVQARNSLRKLPLIIAADG